MSKYTKNRFGSIVLQDKNGTNFTITNKEQQELKTLVKRANQRRRDRTNKYYKETQHLKGMTNVSKDAFMNVMQRKGYITESYSANMGQFTSKEHLKDKLKELRAVTKKGYGDKIVKGVKTELIKRARKVYNSYSKEMVKVLKDTTQGEVMSLFIHNDEIIRAIYGSDVDPDVVEQQAEKIVSDIQVALDKY